MSEPRDESARFLDALRGFFDTQDSSRPVVWVNGGPTRDGHVAVLYRPEAGAPIVGRRWRLADLSGAFGGEGPEGLAEQVWLNEIEDPDSGGQHLDVDWADGLSEDPRAVLWRGEPSS